MIAGAKIKKFFSAFLALVLTISVICWPVAVVNAYTNDNVLSPDNLQLVKSISSESKTEIPITVPKSSQRFMSSSENDTVEAYLVPASNLIVNGDFEIDPNYYGTWKAYDYLLNTAEFIWDDQTFHGSSGNSVGIQGNNVSSVFVNSVAIQPGQTYSFSAWCKVLNVTALKNEVGACLYIGQYDENNNLIAGTDNYFTTGGTTGWEQANLNFITYKNAKNIIVMLMLGGSGTVWLDDVSLTNSGSIPAPPSIVVANPGSDKSTYKGFSVSLDGTRSLTTQGSTLSYNWSFVSKPAGSQCTLTNENTATPFFIPDVAGDYILSLSVNNGLGSTDASQATVKVKEFNDISDNADYNSFDYLPQKSLTGYTVSDIVPLADGWVIISDSSKNNVIILNALTGEIGKSYQLTATPSNIDFDFNNGIIIATQSGTNRIAKIDINTDTISYITTSAVAISIENNDVTIGNDNIVFLLFNKWPNALVSVVDVEQGKEISYNNIYAEDLGFLVFDKNTNNLFLGEQGTSPSSLLRYSYDETNHVLKLEQNIDMGENGQDLSLSNDGRHVAFCCGGGNSAYGYVIFDIDSSDITNKFGEWNTGAYPTSAAFSYDNQYVVTQNYSDIQLFDVATHTLVRNIAQLDGNKVGISRGGKIVYGITGNGIYFYKTDGTSSSTLNIDSISTDIASPQISGTTINVTANTSGGSNNNFYHFLVYDGYSWTLEQSYSTSNTFEWTPPAVGAYDLVIVAKDKCSNNNYDTYSAIKYNVEPNDAEPVSVSIMGADTVAIPSSGSATSQYSAAVENKNGLPVENESVTWSVFDYDYNSTTSLSINDDGLLTVDSNASVGTYYIKATTNSVPPLYSVKCIQLSINSTLSTSNVNYERNTQNPQGIPVYVNYRGNSLVGIRNGDTDLVSNFDYIVYIEGVIVIKGSYLAGLPAGQVTLTFMFSAGENANLNITITDTIIIPTPTPTLTPTQAPTPTPTPTPTLAPIPGGDSGGGGGSSYTGNPGGVSEDSSMGKPEKGSVTVDPIYENELALTELSYNDYMSLINSTIAIDGLKYVTLNIKDVGSMKYETKLDPSVITSSTRDVMMTINTAVASVKLPSNMLTGNSVQGAKGISININKIDKSTLPEAVQSVVGDSPIVDINITVDGKVIVWSNPDAPVTVSVPYTLKTGENGDNITVYYIDSQGKLVNMQGFYDSYEKVVTFTTTHFSKYLVKNVKVSFNDLTGYESYVKYIESMAAKGIIEGIGNDQYAPGKVLTRAEFSTLLVKMLKLDTSDKSIAFSDVKAIDWYVPYINAAYKAGLIMGIGDYKFAPNETITMQDAALILVRAMKFRGGTITSGSLSSIKDSEDISIYAKDGVGFIVLKGIMPLDSEGNFYAKNVVNRAYAAEYIYNVFNFK